jgi:Lrp/AsnC family leucine-responsive transcriptional regulator
MSEKTHRKDPAARTQPALDFREADMALLELLQRDGRISAENAGSALGLPPATVSDRIAELERGGWIRRYKAVVNAYRVGLTVRAFVAVRRTRESRRDEVGRALSAIPEVIACHIVSGEYDFYVEILARDMDHFAQVTLNGIGQIPGVYDHRSTFAIQSLKIDGDLPVT